MSLLFKLLDPNRDELGGRLKSGMTFGRGDTTEVQDNAVRVDDTGVSKEHFRVERSGLGFHVIDLGSANGTQVRTGSTVEQLGQGQSAELHAGSVIRIGNTAITVQSSALVARLHRLPQDTRAAVARSAVTRSTFAGSLFAVITAIAVAILDFDPVISGAACLTLLVTAALLGFAKSRFRGVRLEEWKFTHGLTGSLLLPCALLHGGAAPGSWFGRSMLGALAAVVVLGAVVLWADLGQSGTVWGRAVHAGLALVVLILTGVHLWAIAAY